MASVGAFKDAVAAQVPWLLLDFVERGGGVLFCGRFVDDEPPVLKVTALLHEIEGASDVEAFASARVTSALMTSLMSLAILRKANEVKREAA